MVYVLRVCVRVRWLCVCVGSERGVCAESVCACAVVVRVCWE